MNLVAQTFINRACFGAVAGLTFATFKVGGNVEHQGKLDKEWLGVTALTALTCIFSKYMSDFACSFDPDSVSDAQEFVTTLAMFPAAGYLSYKIVDTAMNIFSDKKHA